MNRNEPLPHQRFLHGSSLDPSLRCFQFPDVVEGIFTSIDAISREAAKILHRPPEENGETLDKLVNGGHGMSVPDNDHHSLQVRTILVIL
ncbi:hypothetical protein TELCIR_02807 [Teladorsagia circumcincta]|uniref:Uncharacterized protein n=1 Tax=Teladorsagia circumcincta TaxID=45464 RepID=A0A2G9UYE5_TELCI|nr:hypothetical protein TELCIR_02807 [Teladorsagia circumcincta]